MVDETGLQAMETIGLGAVESMFETLNDIAFFVKDREGRYLSINRTMVRRCGVRHKREVLGKTALDLFPPGLAETYLAQDRHVIDRGVWIDKHLELHLYPGRSRGWCLTKKTPLYGKDGEVVGLIGTSQDLGMLDELHPAYGKIAHIARYLSEHFQKPVSLKALAEEAGLSLSRVERLFQKVFQQSPRQLLLERRLSAARSLIEKKPAAKIAEIAYECGYTDHSAFSRQFKACVGMSPTQYGKHMKKPVEPRQ